MIIMGAGICQWFHGDATYRAVLALLLLTGSMGRNGGGWAHYVGQEKCRPVTGWATMAMATDWSRPPRQMAGTSYWYAHTDQWRYDGYRADALASPWAGPVRDSTPWTCWPPPRRWGGCRSTPVRSLQPGSGRRGARRAGDPRTSPSNWLGCSLAVTDPDNPANWPRVLDIWRANLLGSSSKGNEYFLRTCSAPTQRAGQPTPEALRPNDIAWHDDARRASSIC
jgi:nitrate reductase alpha subunit